MVSMIGHDNLWSDACRLLRLVAMLNQLIKQVGYGSKILVYRSSIARPKDRSIQGVQRHDEQHFVLVELAPNLDEQGSSLAAARQIEMRKAPRRTLLYD